MRPILPVLVALLVLSCGGGGSSAPPPLTTTLLPVPALTGEIAFPLAVEADHSLRVGDFATNAEVRGFCAIDLTGLPAGAQVESALLHLRKAGSNNFPWDDLGDMVIDHLDLGTILDPDDFNRPSFATAFVVVPSFESVSERDVDVTARVVADLAAGRTTSGFRLRYSLGSDSDGENEFVVLAGSNSSIGPQPYLIVTYRP